MGDFMTYSEAAQVAQSLFDDSHLIAAKPARILVWNTV